MYNQEFRGTIFHDGLWLTVYNMFTTGVSMEVSNDRPYRGYNPVTKYHRHPSIHTRDSHSTIPKKIHRYDPKFWHTWKNHLKDQQIYVWIIGNFNMSIAKRHRKSPCNQNVAWSQMMDFHDLKTPVIKKTRKIIRAMMRSLLTGRLVHEPGTRTFGQSKGRDARGYPAEQWYIGDDATQKVQGFFETDYKDAD